MPKNRAKSKKDKKLRRELEALKAQLKSERGNSTTETTRAVSGNVELSAQDAKNHKGKQASFEEIYVNDNLVKKGLLKTMILSVGAFAVIIALWIKG